MTTQESCLYASHGAIPGSNITHQKYIDQTLPTCSAFDYVCQRNKNHLGDAALNYYGRKFTYADLHRQCQKDCSRPAGRRRQKGRHHHGGQRHDPGGHRCCSTPPT